MMGRAKERAQIPYRSYGPWYVDTTSIWRLAVHRRIQMEERQVCVDAGCDTSGEQSSAAGAEGTDEQRLEFWNEHEPVVTLLRVERSSNNATGTIPDFVKPELCDHLLKAAQ